MKDRGPAIRYGRAAIVASLMAIAPGCRAAPGPPALPDRPPSAISGGERGVLLDQLHRLAAEDARTGHR